MSLVVDIHVVRYGLSFV